MRRVFEYLQIGTGPRRSPSASSEILKKNSMAAELAALQRSARRTEAAARLDVATEPPAGAEGHNYMGHGHMGHDCIGHNRMGHNKMAR